MSELQLPVLPVAAPAITHERYAALARRAKLLSWLSLAWMTVEGTVAILRGPWLQGKVTTGAGRPW